MRQSYTGVSSCVPLGDSDTPIASPVADALEAWPSVEVERYSEIARRLNEIRKEEGRG